MSVLSKAPRPSGDDVRRVALAALAAALDEGTQQQQKAPKRKGGLKTVRTVAAGAALYVAGRAAYNNRDAILEQLQDGRERDDDEPGEDEDEEPVAEEDEDYDEDPAAEEDEDFEDEDEEPVAEEDEDYEEDEEPVAEEDEDYEEDEEPVAEEDEDYDDEDDEPVAEEDEDYDDDDDVDPVGRPPEPPEADADEEHAEVVSR